MLWKSLKVKMRNGMLFNLNHNFNNDNYIELSWDWYSFGFGVKYCIRDTRRFLQADFMWLHFDLWF